MCVSAISLAINPPPHEHHDQMEIPPSLRRLLHPDMKTEHGAGTGPPAGTQARDRTLLS